MNIIKIEEFIGRCRRRGRRSERPAVVAAASVTRVSCNIFKFRMPTTKRTALALRHRQFTTVTDKNTRSVRVMAED